MSTVEVSNAEIFVWDYNGVPVTSIDTTGTEVDAGDESDVITCTVYHIASKVLKYIGLYISGDDKETILQWAASGDYGLYITIGSGSEEQINSSNGTTSNLVTVFSSTTEVPSFLPNDQIQIQLQLKVPPYAEHASSLDLAANLVYTQQVS